MPHAVRQAAAQGQPPVTVCVPTYNAEEYIGECLESVFRQTWQNFELIVVDNCSTDGTFQSAQAALAGRPNVRLLRNESNLGMVGNLNRCLESARGEWIKLLFSDDTLEPSCLERMVHYTRWHCPLIGCKRNILPLREGEEDPGGRLRDNRNLLEQHRAFIDSLYPSSCIVFAESMAKMVCRTPMMNLIGEPNCLLLHRSILEELGRFDPEFTQYMDWEFMARIATQKGLLMISEHLVNFRVHAGSSTQKNFRRSEIELVDHFLLHRRYLFHPHYAVFRRNCSPECLRNLQNTWEKMSRYPPSRKVATRVEGSEPIEEPQNAENKNGHPEDDRK